MAALEINKYIIELLYQSDRVTLPEFGSLIAVYQPAELDNKKNLILPPKKKIKFDAGLKGDDRKLLQIISNKEQLSENEARDIINQHVEHIRQEIKKSRNYVFDKIGKLIELKDGELVLEPHGELSFLYDVLGLKPVELQPLTGTSSRKDVKPKPSTQRDKNSKTGQVKDKEKTAHTNKRVTEPANAQKIKQVADQKKAKPNRTYDKQKTLSRIAIVTPVVIALIFLLVYLNLERRTEEHLNFNMESTQEESASNGKPSSIAVSGEEGEKKPVFEDKINEMTKKEQALYYEEEKNRNIEKYYIIAGSFTNLNNARSYKNDLSGKGFTPKIIERNGEGYRVAIGEFQNKSRALDELIKLRNTYNQSVWLLTRKKSNSPD